MSGEVHHLVKQQLVWATEKIIIGGTTLDFSSALEVHYFEVHLRLTCV